MWNMLKVELARLENIKCHGDWFYNKHDKHGSGWYYCFRSCLFLCFENIYKKFKIILLFYFKLVFF